MRKFFEISLGVIALSIPLYAVGFSLFGVPFYVPEILIYLVFGIFWVHYFLTGRKHKFTCDATLILVLSGLLLVSLLSIIGLASSEVFEGREYAPLKTALGIWKAHIFAPVIYFWLMNQFALSRVAKSYIKRGFLIGMALLGVVSIALGSVADDGRLLGFFGNPNYLAMLMAPAFWLCIEEFIAWNKSRLYYLERVLYISIFAVVLLMTRSYASILAVLLIAGLRIFLTFPGKKKAVFGVFALIMIAIIGYREIGTGKFSQTLDAQERSSTSVRLEIWEVGGKFWLDDPFSGIGLGDFQLAYFQGAWDKLGHEPYEWNILHAHSLYLQWLVETGLFGLLFFLAFVFLVIRKKSFDEGAYVNWVLGVILINGLFDLPFFAHANIPRAHTCHLDNVRSPLRPSSSPRSQNLFSSDDYQALLSLLRQDFQP